MWGGPKLQTLLWARLCSKTALTSCWFKPLNWNHLLMLEPPISLLFSSGAHWTTKMFSFPGSKSFCPPVCRAEMIWAGRRTCLKAGGNKCRAGSSRKREKGGDTKKALWDARREDWEAKSGLGSVPALLEVEPWAPSPSFPGEEITFSYCSHSNITKINVIQRKLFLDPFSHLSEV